jgi:hypothetical protein
MATTWAELLMEDHQTTEKVFEAVLRQMQAPDGPPPGLVQDVLDYFTAYVDGCHNKKEENHLFPLIEARGVPRHGGPLAVMLGEHDRSKVLLARLQTLGRRYVAGDKTVLDDLQATFEEYAELLKNHFWKENDILYPMARRVMSEADAASVVSGIEATEAAIGPETRAKYYALATRITQAGSVEDLALGVDPHVMAAMLNTLPIELSFVDADDRVRYFSHENGQKIFPRTRGVIGMAVQNCHPAKSVHMVNAILESFKAGHKDVAEFWIEMGGRKLHIRYFPVRNAEGGYLGCLETVQDITRIQALKGERRLLDWETTA